MRFTDAFPVPLLSRSPFVRLDRPSVQTTFQFLGTLQSAELSPESLAEAARSVVCDWIQGQFGEPLPSGAPRGESFEATAHAQHLECAAIPAEGLWSIRLTCPDVALRGRAAVPDRTWTIETTILRSAPNVRFGIRVLCVSPQYADDPVPLNRPQIIVDLADRFTLCEAHPIGPSAWQPASEEELLSLYDLVRSPARGLPVYMLTVPDERHLNMPVAPYLLNHDSLAYRVQGLAYVVAMPRDIGFKWTALVGKPWSAFWGAVRTYRPGLDFDADLPTDHPLLVAQRVLAFQYKGQIMDRAVEDFLVDRAHEHSATRHVDWGKCLFYVDARRRRAELSRAHAADDTQWRALYEEEVSSLREKLKQLERERDDALSFADMAEKERDAAAQENHRFRARLESLTRALTERTGRSPDEQTPIPHSYEDMPDWVNQRLAGRLFLHPRAANRALKLAAYADIAQVYRVLLLLANDYRNMRMGLPGAKTGFDRRLEQMNLRVDTSISRERAGEQGDTYFVRYPYPSSPQRFIEDHIRSRGNSRDPARCLAVYYFWDDDTRQVVVCWLPSHLDNRLT